ncbi:hypothetical protein cje104_04566 [Campylobacter jejuni subsp. jejuni LMG 23223]|nr:hypothetical protein cje104_04566 [Campylobacter jejuni subsp. jejuni LMG 23223]
MLEFVRMIRAFLSSSTILLAFSISFLISEIFSKASFSKP